MKRIVVATDFSEHARAAGRIAAGLARRKEASLTLVHGLHLLDLASLPSDVREHYAGTESELAVRQLEHERDALALAAGGAVSVDIALRRGDPVPEILALVREVNADLIAIGTRGPIGDRRVELGSVALRLTRQASCPVLVTRSDRDDRLPPNGLFRAPLVAIDFSRFSEPAARLAAEIAEADQMVEMVHVYRAPDVGGRDDLTEYLGEQRALELERLRELASRVDLAPLKVRYRTEIGPIVAQMLDYVHNSDTDVLVLGAHGRDRAVELIGSVADRLLRVSPVPVIVLPEASIG